MRVLFPALARYGKWIEDALLVAAFVVLVLLAGLQILLRNVFDTGFGWIDPLLRILVLWVGMLGAVAASRDDRHINIDILSRFIPRRLLPWSKRVVALASTLVCGLLAWHTFRFVRDEYAYSDVEVAGMPVWFWQSILPLGFALMTWRFAIAILRPPRLGGSA